MACATQSPPPYIWALGPFGNYSSAPGLGSAFFSRRHRRRQQEQEQEEEEEEEEEEE